MKPIDEARQEALQRRGANVQWTISGDYDWNPPHTADDEAAFDLYAHIVSGARHRYYDEALLSSFCDYLRQQHPQARAFEAMLDLAVESGVAERLESTRPAVRFWRKKAARDILDQRRITAAHDEVELLQQAHAQRILGQVPTINPMTTRLLNRLEALGSLETADLVEQMQTLLREEFHFLPSPQAERALQEQVDAAREHPSKTRQRPSESEAELEKQFAIQSAEFTSSPFLDEAPREDREERLLSPAPAATSEEQLRAFMEARYGLPSLDARTLRALTQSCATGLHEGSKLLVTRGELPPETSEFRRQQLAEVRQKNEAYLERHRARIHRTIARLSDRIQNTVLNEIEEEPVYARDGQLVAGLLWRPMVMEDARIFRHLSHEEVGTFSVDLLLDGSASQQERQEQVAAQAYIIASALQRCHVPLRVHTFHSQQGYTILHELLDHRATRADSVLNYAPDAANRDGFALRVLRQRIESEPRADRRLLIMLSDGKPFDERTRVNAARNHSQTPYRDAIAVDDTAQEVRRFRQSGIALLGVFTGEEEDLPAARRIFGTSFVYTKKMERFADIVSTFLREKIKEA